MSDVIDWIGVIEAVYAIEQPREPWIDGVLRAAAPLTGCTGVGVILYDVCDSTLPRLDLVAGLNVPSAWIEMARAGHNDPSVGSIIVQNARKYMCTSSREYLRNFGSLEQLLRDSMTRVGLRETVVVNGLDSSGLGFALHLLSDSQINLSSPVLGSLKRLASHLATAYRLQRLVSKLDHAAPTGEAILDGDGQLLHAEGEAKTTESRSSLVSATEQYLWARGKARHEQPAPAVDAWKALVAARWSLREQVDTDGKSYIHALANEPSLAGPSALSAREQQVASLAALGRSNKLIGYELGLAHATVRVLMARAAKKLGARSRAELIERLAALSTTDPSR